MAKELPNRSEVRKEDTWAIEDMYGSLSAWEGDIRRAQDLAEQARSKEHTMTDCAKELYEVLELYQECYKLLYLAANYANRAADVDTRNMENQANQQRVTGVLVEVASSLAFLEPKILEIPKETLEQWMKEEPGLSEYRIWFQELRRREAHTLSPEMEELLASAGEMQQTPGQIFSMFNNADVEFPEITDEAGEQVRITSGRYISMQCSSDRRVRKESFQGLYHTYRKFENTLAAAYSGQVKQLIFEAKARHYDSTLEAAVDANNVSPKVYENLVETINENMDKMHRYITLRKKCLGVEELHMYDVYVPMIKEVDRRISFEEAKETVLEALRPLGEGYVNLIREGFTHRWIDVYENQGKRSGAYAAGAYGAHPFVLLNYDEKLDDMFTLAHEMGHALHFYFSNENQPFLYSQYKIFVAEVASTCNEVLLMEYLLAKTQDKKERAYLINHFLESFRTTVYRQTMFAEYEKVTNEMAEAGKSLTAEVLKQTYYDLNCKYYGLDMVSDEEIAWEWCRIPHFYYNFYVYQYATGFSAAVAIARRILQEGEPAVKDYLRFLSGGCSDSPVELLKIAGVDMSAKEPIQAALNVFGELLDEMESLILE
ncbi:MAG: oligoendopeptidase F [Lachnospiraceae bacterium]|nr:oligoendopeptidase F [Lachnospiraceae bacterium]